MEALADFDTTGAFFMPNQQGIAPH